MKNVLGWLAGKAALYLLLLAAIAFASFVLPWIQSEIEGGARHAEQASAIEAAIVETKSLRAEAQAELERSATEFRSYGEARIASELQGKRAERSRLQENLSALGPFDRIDPRAIVERKKTEIEVSLLERQIIALEAAQKAAQGQAALDKIAPDGKIPTAKAVEAARQSCANARAAVAAHEQRWDVERELRDLVRQEGEQLESRRESACNRAERLARRRDTGLSAARALVAARAWQAGTIEDVSADLSALYDQEQALAEGSLSGRFSAWAERNDLAGLMRSAAVAFFLMLATPYFIRLIFYYFVAPFAEKRGAIRLKLPGPSDQTLPLCAGQGTSVPVVVDKGTTLLVRQGYLQSTPITAAKRTQWMLDTRHPISTLASGLWFLTRIDGNGEVTTISSLGNPLAEVALLDLPENAACVLHPRALVAVVQPHDHPLRITSHWRILSLNAWLTGQLRYLVFHGRAQLVVEGGRGVRVEPADKGRIFGQDQLVGFSADLSYAVIRSETFWPYFLGRESLFKDRVLAGKGMLVIEETPLGKRSGKPKRGLEGALDAVLSAFGL